MKRLTTCTAYGLLLALPALLGGCWDKCTDELFSADQRAYFIDFRPGDYWIYRNVANGDIDSVYYAGQVDRPGGISYGCIREGVAVQFNGFAKSLIFAYSIGASSTVMSATAPATVDLYTNYELADQKATQIGSRSYPQSVDVIECCLTGNGCLTKCDGTAMRFMRLTFAKSVGIVRWTAIRHPQFGDVTYELIRSNKL
jgi:hypothetical protein